MFKHILIPTDGSAHSAKAINHGMLLARDAGARVTVLIVVEPFHIFSMDSSQLTETQAAYEKHAKEAADRYLEEAKRKAEVLGVPCEIVQIEHAQPYKAIVDTAAARGVDLIAMASHGRRGASAILLGSETTKVLTNGSIPVLVYR